MGLADLRKRAALKRPDLYYLAAGLIGLAAALIGAIGAPHVELARDPAAVVNGVPIPREALTRAVLALEADSRNAVTPEREQAALERLIEEELLVQHGVDLGLAETDFAARRAMVQSVLALAIAERAGDEPSESQLRRFYQDNAGFFAPPPRVSATVLYFREGTPVGRIEAARAALARGEAVEGDPLTIPVPRAALTANEWRRLLGAGAGDAVEHLQLGQVSAPVRVSGGALLMRVNGFVAVPAGRYEDVAAQVRAEWGRRADEEAARAYIERLKRRARIERRDVRAASSAS
ncbi:peptidyl-prolyl cis-trans isomerase [Terricaulis sp.]|uniref:peptidylprolyl isomerase n=1 Tax=Terricaulis sp. TaxID=2768686 RepID=UPI003784B0AF